MSIEHLEQLSGYRVEPRVPGSDRSGIRRSARLVALAIRATRRHPPRHPSDQARKPTGGAS